MHYKYNTCSSLATVDIFAVYVLFSNYDFPLNARFLLYNECIDENYTTCWRKRKKVKKNIITT